MQHLIDRIMLDSEVRSGKPVIRGTRITVSDTVEYLAGGMSPAEILVTSLPRCHASPSRMCPPAELKASPFPQSEPPRSELARDQAPAAPPAAVIPHQQFSRPIAT